MQVTALATRKSVRPGSVAAESVPELAEWQSVQQVLRKMLQMLFQAPAMMRGSWGPSADDALKVS